MATIQENYKYMALPSNIKRGNPIPLDTTAVWYSYEEMADYAKNFPTAYVGQVLSLVDKETGYSQAFIILNEAGDLKQVGVLPTPDYTSIDIEKDDTLHLHNWGKQYYRYVSATEIEEAYWELQIVDEEHPWKEDLQPKVATNEEGNLVLEWFEPSSILIEDVAEAVTNLTEKTEILDFNLNQVTNEVTQVTEQVNQHNTLITELLTTVSNVNEQSNNNTTDITNLTAQVKNTETQVNNNTTNITNLTENIVELQTVLNETNADLDSLELQLIKKANSEDVYTKTESDTKIAEAIASANHLKRKIFQDEIAVLLFIAENPDIADQYIYMIPTGLQYDANKYYEYLVIDGALEQIGNWDIDLSDYCTENEVTALLNNYYTAVQTDAKLDTKVDAITTDGRDWLLLSPENQDKLAALVIGDEGIEISGKVNAENVEGLSSWVTANKDSVEGLFPTSALEKLATIQEGAQKNYIVSVADELNVSNGTLSVNSIDATKINNLETHNAFISLQALINSNTTAINNVQNSVNDLSKELNKYVLLTTYEAEIAALKDAVAWHMMV